MRKNCKYPLYSYFWLSLVFIGGCGDNNSQQVPLPEQVPPLFTLLSPDATNVLFENTLIEGSNTNILVYEYFYNGGGVAAGDLNGDTLIDLYFTSNMGENKLYINLGDMQFKEVAAISKTSGRAGPWKTGTTLVDINGDNRLDIYLCYSGALPEPKRTNQLFVNQGNDDNGIPLFKEQAQEYGLASTAYSNQAYFFDSDKDGDLDLLLLNHNPKSLPILNEVKTKQLLQEDDPLRGLRFYRQSNGKFEDATRESGINGSPLSYGLGLGISDLNNDGWPDIYVSNDYAVNDYLYFNENGTFSNRLDESIGHTSQFSMGNDIADINNDGLSDIITLDMLPEDNRRQKLLLSPDNYEKFDHNVRSGFHYQYMRNMLQVNNGNGSFSEIGQLSGISNTDWSWSALLADYDNDGRKDLFVTNGYYRDFTNLDFINYMDNYVRSKGRLMREDVLEIIEHMPSSEVSNYMFANGDDGSFSNKTNLWGFEHTANSNGAAYADLDNDGDLDLITNNIGEPAFVYRNESQRSSGNHFLDIQLRGEGLNTQGIGTKATIWVNGKSQQVEQYLSRGYLSSISPTIHFGLDDADVVDSLLIEWPDGKQQLIKQVSANQTLQVRQEEAKNSNDERKDHQQLFAAVDSPIAYKHVSSNVNDFKRQPLLNSELSFSGPCMVAGDVNNDGLSDIFIGGTKGQSAALYIQQKDQRFSLQSVPAFAQDKEQTDADAEIFDANGDGFMDIYVASGGYHSYSPDDPLLQDRLYINDRQGGFSSAPEALPPMLVSKGCVKLNDINQDGFLDLFVGGRVIPGRYPETPSSFLLINDGKGHFSNEISSIAPELEDFGMITDAAWTDLDLDGSKELVVVGDWVKISIFENRDEHLIEVTGTYVDRSYTGWWNKIMVADFNNDQKPDLMIGNVGTNTQFKVSDKEPAEIYFKDYDENGSIDPIFSFYLHGARYPWITRDELLSQLPKFRSRFSSYESYADVTLDQLFEKKELDQSGHLRANHMETTLLLSSPDGKLAVKALPIEVQYAPIYAMAILDYNLDNNLDVLLCGNNAHAKLRQGKFDANYGVLLRGTGDGNFDYINQSKSGFRLMGDVRSIARVNNILLFGINEKPLVAYEQVP